MRLDQVTLDTVRWTYCPYNVLRKIIEWHLNNGSPVAEIHSTLQRLLTESDTAPPDRLYDTVLEVLDCFGARAPTGQRFQLSPKQVWEWHKAGCKACGNKNVPCSYLDCPTDGRKLHREYQETVAWP